jgi:enoyl-CoA hydratase/carnithine racemase
MIELSQRGRIAILTMRHGKANTLDTELCNESIARFEQARAAADAIVLTGQGTIFSAGVDLKRAIEGGAAYLREFLPVLSKAIETIFFHPKPVVAAINGHAIAGGCVIACAADRRLMARDSGRIGVTELLVGVPFPAAAFEVMRHAAAPQYFEAILGGTTYAPDEGRERGLVNEVVAADDLLERAVRVAEALAALSPPAFAVTKMQSRRAAQEALLRSGPSVDAAVREIWLAPDTLARMRDYVARTLK